MKEYKVQFINYDLGRNAVVGHVTGRCGKNYLSSRYRNGRHESEMITLEEYDGIIRDVAHRWHLPMCRWIPVFVEVPAATGEVTSAPLVDGTDRTDGTDSAELSSETDVAALEAQPFSTLRKLANEKRRRNKLTINTGRMKKSELIEFLKAA